VHNLGLNESLSGPGRAPSMKRNPSSREDDQDVSGRPALKTVPILAVVPGAGHLLTTIQGRRNRLSCSRRAVEFPSERLGASWKMGHNARRPYIRACRC